METLSNTLVKNDIKHQYNAIDLFKFICSLLVIMIHVSPFQNMAWEINFVAVNIAARMAVPFFFTCTGFFTFKKIDKNNINFSVIKKSAVKILKLYLIWTVIYAPLKLFTILNSSEDIKASLLAWLKEFFLSGSYVHLWYLRAMFVALILIAIMLKLKLKTKGILLCSSILFFVGMFEYSYTKILGLFGNVPSGLLEFIKGINDFFITTRNGSCFALLFVVLGMIIAWYPIKLNIKSSFVLFMISFICMIIEAVVEVYFNLQQTYDKYLLLPLVMFFLFIVVENIKLKPSGIFIKFRNLSAWIYFIHILCAKLISLLLDSVIPLEEYAFLKFILTLILSVLISLALMYISNTKYFKWLKKLI